MDSSSRLIARKMFRLRICQSKGDAYQDLFEQIMVYRHPDFQKVRPYGNIGDRKNDGYCPSSGTFYQVYAPENPENHRTPVLAATKARDDFRGMLSHWNKLTPVRDYRFVFNDEYKGSPPQVEEAMLEIHNNHNITTMTLLAHHLENEAMQLADDQLLDIIQCPIPSPDLLPSVDFSVLREVVQHILKLPIHLPPASKLKAPDFDEKIEFNGLSVHVATFLRHGAYQTDAIDDYFSTNSTFAKQELRDQLAALYEQACRSTTSYTGDDRADLVFFKLLKLATPITSTAHCIRAAQEATIVVMAYFFEACDIFEDPHAAA